MRLLIVGASGYIGSPLLESAKVDFVGYVGQWEANYTAFRNYDYKNDAETSMNQRACVSINTDC